MRKPLPDILTDLSAQPQPAPGFDLAAAIAGAAPPEVDLYFDYAGLGAAGAAIRDHAIAIKLCGKRRAEATVEAGEHLIAVKETIPHGQWEPWLRQELGMDERTGQSMMQIARRFGSKAKLIALLSPTVLGVLAPPSVPDAAIDAAIAAAEVSPVTVTAAKAIIAAHRPARCRKCGRTLTDPAAIRTGIGACCQARMNRAAALGEAKETAEEDRPLPAWATNGETVAVPPDFAPVVARANPAPALAVAPPQADSAPQGETHTDGRAAALARLAARLEGWVEELRDVAQQYGELTGDYLTPVQVKRGLEKMQVVVQANGENGGWD